MIIRRLPRTGYAQTNMNRLGQQEKVLDWFEDFDTVTLKPNHLVAEIDLIDSYEVEDERRNFWMEPSESYHLPVLLEIEPGNYLAMVTFIGARGEFEFWRRFFVIQVDDPRPRSAIQDFGKAVAKLFGGSA